MYSRTDDLSILMVSPKSGRGFLGSTSDLTTQGFFSTFPGNEKALYFTDPRMNLLKTCLTVAVIVYISAAFANDASFYGDGATVFEFKEDRVSMVRESIVIHYDESAGDPSRQWLARCEFTFRNDTSEAVEVQMGFPDWNALDPDESEPGVVRDFEVQVAGDRVNAIRKIIARDESPRTGSALGDLGYDAAYTWQVRFAPGQSIVVRNRYRIGGLATNGPFSACVSDEKPSDLEGIWWRRAAAETGGWDFENGACRRITYLVTTGRTWGRPIAEAEIAIQIPPDAWPHLVVPLPNAASVQGQWVKWKFENWTPERELKVVFVRPLFPESSAWLPLFDTQDQAREWTGFARRNGFSQDLVAILRQAYQIRHGARPDAILARLIDSWGEQPVGITPLSTVEQGILSILGGFEEASGAGARDSGPEAPLRPGGSTDGQ
jgi:hypothetical protein